MRRIAFYFVLLVSVLALASPPVHAQSRRPASGDAWVRLGALSLDTFANRDALDLEETGVGYKAVRLEAKNAGVVISRVQVVWQGAPLHTEDRTINLLAGERTRPIGPQATPRQINRVGIVYQVPGGPKSEPPLVEVFALRSGTAPASPSTARPSGAADGGVLIGSQAIGFGADRQILRTDPNAGQFARLGIKPQQNDVFIDEVRVVFGDGGSSIINVGQNLTVDGPTHWLDLNAEKPIKEVDVTYRSRPNFRGAARLDVFGSAVHAPVATRSTRGARTVSATQRAGTPCITETICTPLAVFFGTNRERKDVDGHVTFTENRGDGRLLGQAIVTVPRAYRKKGEIPRPSWWDLARLSNPFAEDPARHFTILNGATLVYASEEAFLAAVRNAVAQAGSFKEHAFVFVHGYNVSFEHALYRTAQIAYDLGQDDTPFGTAFLYSWPSAGEVESYIYDLESAEKAVPHLESFLDLVVAKSGAQHVHLIAHSMGNAPLLAALSNIAARGTNGATINQVILAAPDVDAKDFAALSARILPIARTLTLYASSQDRAILASRKVRRDLPRAGDVINGLPVIVPGLDTIDVSTVNTGILSLNHSAYADRKELLNDMRRLMLTGERPPDVRDISIRKITEQAGTFWRFIR